MILPGMSRILEITTLSLQFSSIREKIDISDGTWYDKDRNKSAISRKGDGYGIGTGNKIP